MSEDLCDLFSTALPDLQIRMSAPRGTLWLSCGSDTPAFCLLSIGGRPCLWHSDRVAAIATDLDLAEPLLNRVEHASGWRFEPEQVTPSAPERVLVIGDGDTMMELAIDPERPPPPSLVAAAAAAPRDRSRPRPRVMKCQIPDVPVEQAAALEAGDLLIIPSVVKACIEDCDTGEMSFEFATGRLTASRWDDASSRFAVPVDVHLSHILLSDCDLEAIANGGAVVVGLPLKGTEAGLAVGGRDIARGSVVSLGQANAIRIDFQREHET